MMFDPEFFPTPEEVIHEMLKLTSVRDKIVLEPSAGKGNIVDSLTEAKEVLACEQSPELRKILQGKCRVIGNDFFEIRSEQVSHIDCIIMNPPFSNADKHIIHAWDIAPDGCEIIALCNKNTITRTYSQYRKQFTSIISDHGNWSNLGNCFSTAERTTDVEVALVYLKKPGEGYSSEFEGFIMEEEEEEQGEGIMPYNFVRDLVNRYINAIKLFDKQLELGVQMSNLTNQFYKSDIAFHCTEGDKITTRNDFKKDLQKAAWKYVFAKMKMERYTTRGLKNEINNFVEKQHNVPFTMRNIYWMLEMVIGTHGQRMEKALEEVFDAVTYRYHDNRYNVEGWKTNSHYLINQKFILSGLTEVGYNGEMKLAYRMHGDIIEDMNKALCWLTGTNYDTIPSLYTFINYTKKPKEEWEKEYREEFEKREWGTWYDWGFFEFKGFKKGTIHFKFKSEDVWGKFNQRIAKIKGYPLYEKAA